MQHTERSRYPASRARRRRFCAARRMPHRPQEGYADRILSDAEGSPAGPSGAVTLGKRLSPGRKCQKRQTDKQTVPGGDPGKMPLWCNGSTPVSHTGNAGSIPVSGSREVPCLSVGYAGGLLHR